jgi:hypothetical protein
MKLVIAQGSSQYICTYIFLNNFDIFNTFLYATVP